MKCTGIIIAYNHEKYIKKSIQSYLEQTEKFNEIIIIDDKSSDNTNQNITEILDEYRGLINIKYIQNKINKGAVSSLKDAIKLSTGNVIFLQAGDDYSNDKRVEISSNLFKTNSNINIMYSSYGLIDNLNNIQYLRKRNKNIVNIKYYMKKTHFPPNYGIAFREYIGDQFCKHVPDSLENEDDTLAFIGIMNGGIHMISKVLYYYRVHEESMTGWINFENNKDNFIKMSKLQFKSEEMNVLVWYEIAIKEKLVYLQKYLEKKLALREMINKNEYKYLYRCINLISIKELVIIIGGFNLLYYFELLRKKFKRLYYAIFFNN
jgi:glycosyltransferase involved in cell wall biosynthesis